ncbi:hypothetical protein [Lolliginicoccus levis]|uniref:hypothetical protein n=1 Tax=Lolliginicoccus levis TaxID=2919542 RepID=UPI00241D59BF|nr:hypothetical protein [Lolliginicoccus levis]
MRKFSHNLALGSRIRTAIVGITLVTGLSIAAFFVAKRLPRDTADSLHGLTATLILLAILAFLVTFISVFFRQQSMTFHWILAFLAAAIAVAAYPISKADQDVPVIFSLGILNPVGVGVCIATVVLILFRVFFVDRSSSPN